MGMAAPSLCGVRPPCAGARLAQLHRLNIPAFDSRHVQEPRREQVLAAVVRLLFPRRPAFSDPTLKKLDAEKAHIPQ
jgi:hypothetical protein